MKTEELIETSLDEILSATKELVLHNDDFNTFDHVINCLISHCGHSEIQAEQSAFIVHNNGKCSVKRGSLNKLKPIKNVLQLQNLTVDIK